MNLANLFSIYRIAVTPVIIYAIYQNSFASSVFALSLLLLAFISDTIDGYLARRTDKVTKVGSFLDPFADKFLVVCLIFVFWLREDFSIYYLSIFVLRDIIFLIMRMMSSREDINIQQEKKYSSLVIKAQFFLVFTLVASEVLAYSGYQRLSFLDMIVALVSFIVALVTIGSVAAYVTIYWHLLNKKKRLGKLAKKEKMVVLANKKSSGYHDGYRRKLLNKFCERRGAELVYLPETKDMYKGMGEKLKKIKHVVIAGGDGSFESALNYRPFWKKALGFFPLGAGNAYYSYFFKGKRFEYLRSRFRFREVPLDVLSLDLQGKTILTGFLSLGIDAEIPRLTEQGKQHGLMNYVKAAASAIPQSKAHFQLAITVDGKRYHLKNCINLTLAKIPYYGYSIRSLIGKTDMKDGFVYGLAVINRHSTASNKPLRLWTLLLTALNMERDPLLPLKGKRITVESKEPFPIQAGGEFIGYSKKIKVKVMRQQNVLMI